MKEPVSVWRDSTMDTRPPPALARLRLTLWALIAVFLLVMAIGTASLLGSLRRAALNDAQAQVMRFATVVSAVANRTFLSIDRLLVSTDDLLDLSGLMVGWERGNATSALLRSTLRQMQIVRTLVLMDAHGQVLASSDPEGARLRLQLPEGLLANLRTATAPVLVVSDPATGADDIGEVLYFARYFQLASGERIVAMAEVPVSALVPMMAQGIDIQGLEVTLERSNGALLLGMPRSSVQAGARPQALPLPPDSGAAKAGAGAGSGWGRPARLSQRPGLVVASTVLYHDLWLTASLPLQDALQPWQGERRSVLALALVLVLVALLGGSLTQAYFTRARRARRALAEAKTTLDQALESMVSGFLLLDARHRVLQWNRRFEEFFPWLSPTMAPHLPFRQVLEATAVHHLPHAGSQELERWLEHRLHLQASSHGPHEQTLPNGRVVQIIERPTPQGGIVISYQDVTDLRRASAEIETLAFYDPLTGLPNRRLLLERLRQALQQSAGSGRFGAVLFLDLNQFKLLNDTQGHEVGDLLLQQVAERLRQSVRETDTVARLGGDEFVVVLQNLSGDASEAATQARTLGETILARLRQPYDLAGHEHHSSASVGVTLLSHHHDSVDEVLKQADMAMYRAKDAGRNTLRFFDPDMQQEVNRRAMMEAALHNGLRLSQFLLLYQPQVDDQARVTGAEALVRWLHPLQGLVPPAEFIPLAEECGLILPLGEWVMETAMRQQAQWRTDPALESLCLAINVSARQFLQEDFVERVLSLVQRTGADPTRIKLELTESLLLANVDNVIATMHALRAHGLGFSLDDFGTGYSSLSYLKRLPLDQIKIDQGFVRGVLQHPSDAAIARTIIALADSLGLGVIAEGVETAEHHAFLLQHGCKAFQGYLFGRPMALDEFERRAKQAT